MSSAGGISRAGQAPAADEHGSEAHAVGGGRLPDFFIVGQPKTGTTALYEMLRVHPLVFMPENKEPWFFAEELHERTPPRPQGTPATLQEYRSLFEPARPEQRVGEASALYLWSRTAARRISEVCPDARIIAIVREPASLLRSLHLQFVQTYIETENDFAKAIALERPRSEGRDIPRRTYWPKALLYSEHVRYVEQLERYRELFGAEQMRVIVYDDFRADNDGTVASVLEFLGVPQTAELQAQRANPTVHVRSQRLNELIHALEVGHGPLSGAVKRAVKALTPRPLRRAAVGATRQRLLYRSPPPPDAELMRELRVRFRPEVQALAEYLERDLEALWGYDEL